MNEEGSNSMDEVVEVSQGLENACRLCLTTEQTRSSIFGVPHVSVPFAEKIRACLAVQVTSNDKLPTVVCTTCIQNINHWHSYKDVVSKSQEKLRQWLAKQSSIQPMVTVKEEPVDVEFRDDNAQTVTIESNMANHVTSALESVEVDTESNLTPIDETAKKSPEQPPKVNERIDKENSSEVQVKIEPIDTEDEDDCNIDVESVNSGELLLNPMAVAAANNANNDRVMEADSTQKFTRKYVARKRMRRGPHTHFRGARLFKKKCVHCKINLHSKYSYTQHMSRYHGIVNNLRVNDSAKPPKLHPLEKQKSKLLQHPDNSDPDAYSQYTVNPDEVEFEKMIKTDPLTPVQKNIIGQLKTFSCYSCKSVFSDRRQTLNHIRQHMPELRPFTCIACLTEFCDRSTYKLHCGASFECAMKIALVIPKGGSEKYFTCNMCLRPLSNRRELLSHLAIHIDKQQQQLAQPVRSPVKFKSDTKSPTVKSDETPILRTHTSAPGPYMNGDPAHNHMCDLCGMIYRYKPNMFKHRDLCSTLPENIRTSYRCFYCNMTYLVYKKFYTHVLHDHKKREIICYTCNARLPTPDDYLTHHETHRVISNKEIAKDPANDQPQDNDYSMSVDPLNDSHHPMDVSEKPFNCALCGEDFTSKAELSEHRNLHLKVKIYSCVICRSMFSSSGALEIHMKEHGIDDASEQNANSSCVVEYGRGSRSQNSLNMSLSATSDPGGHFNHCYLCGKNFSNYANLKRHEKNLHIGQKRRWSCDECKRRFKSLEAYEEHVKLEHGPHPQQPRLEKAVPVQPLHSPTGKPLMQCPKCPKTFTYQGNLILHCQNVHKENHFERIVATARLPQTQAIPPRRAGVILTSRGHACDICGKTFREEQSLKTHRGWHLRTNYRLKKDLQETTASLNNSTLNSPEYTMTPVVASSPKPAKARKSFPNNPPQRQLDAIPTLQCQVCDDRFYDVSELRKHLWDVHCARNKPERTFTSELQCELCTNKFQDEDALEDHMKWHSQNPILSSNSNSNSNSVSSAITAVPERKTFYCEICGKYYSNHKVFLRHKKLHKVLPATSMLNLQSLQSRRHYCHPCQKNFSTEASLRRHKASPCHMSAVRAQIHAPAKKITTTAIVHHPPPDTMKLQAVKKEPGLEYATTSQLGISTKKRPVTCHICKMIFPNMSVLYQHKQHSHKVPGLKNKISSQQTECVPLMSAEGMVCCNLCGKQFPGVSNLKQHFALKHRVKSATFPCYAPGCKLVFSSQSSLKAHETSHSSMIYNCNLCDRHVFSKAAMTKHMTMMHKAIFQSGADKSTLWSQTDLTTYSVKNCQSTECPKCKIKYPNLRALKIHYLKFHESA